MPEFVNRATRERNQACRSCGGEEVSPTKIRALKRQHADVRPAFVDGQEGTALDVLSVGFESVGGDADGSVREQILSAELDDARLRLTAPPARIAEKSRLLVMRTKSCLFAHARSSTSGAVAAPIVDQWTASTRERQAGRPSLATGSCPRGASRLAKWNFDFLSPPRGVGQCLSDVFGLEVGGTRRESHRAFLGLRQRGRQRFPP